MKSVKLYSDVVEFAQSADSKKRHYEARHVMSSLLKKERIIRLSNHYLTQHTNDCPRYVAHDRSFTREYKSPNDTDRFLDSCVGTF